jgi:hypothetical protein
VAGPWCLLRAARAHQRRSNGTISGGTEREGYECLERAHSTFHSSLAAPWQLGTRTTQDTLHDLIPAVFCAASCGIRHLAKDHDPNDTIFTWAEESDVVSYFQCFCEDSRPSSKSWCWERGYGASETRSPVPGLWSFIGQTPLICVPSASNTPQMCSSLPSTSSHIQDHQATTDAEIYQKVFSSPTPLHLSLLCLTLHGQKVVLFPSRGHSFRHREGVGTQISFRDPGLAF